ncbi:ATP-binding cassette domain-containing protein [Pararobbsia alpina]|uniref:Vitamin B12 import ATP-binding protein BtuD n=1 Tax=Pararobbsia alpina TaxID=621374 RepID=A0A6S7BAP3_9BURK|nr:ATP-binding cassette domain-containing protein [Pararobbsia alpina]CAB3792880.1 Vitamin B12 import ATP-binding protein BtuD [Pararobbsia alpina]
MTLPRPLRWLGALLALYLVAPLLTVVPQLAQADWSALGQRTLWQATEVSFASATLATVLIGLGGIPLGYYLARHASPASRVLGFVVQLPLALPPLVAGVLLLFLVGPYTVLGRLASAAGLPLTDSFSGVVLAETFVAAPFLIVAARSAFLSVDRDLEHVAATLGYRASARFFKVSLPLAWPTILAGLLLAWLRAIGEFGATVMVAYHPYTLPVYTFVSFSSEGLSAMLPILLPTLLSALLIIAAVAVLRYRHGRVASDGHAARRILAHTEAQMADRQSLPRTVMPEVDLDFQLRHRYRAFELDLKLSTRARRIAVLGPSGSGKSLSLRLLAGLAEGHDSIVAIDGARIDSHLPEVRQIGYVPQNYALFPHLRVAEQLLFAPDAMPARAAYWAQRFGLMPLLERLPSQLSLGQQQRVALARALARPSRLLLLDEPFAALDTPLRTRLRRALRTLQHEFDGTTIIVTHDPQDAAELSDEIVVMDAGRLLQHGPASELFRRPASVEIAGLLGVENVFEAHMTERGSVMIATQGHAGLEIEPCNTRLAADTRCLVRIPARAIRVTSHGMAEATIEDRFEMPNRVRVVLRVGELMLDSVQAHVEAQGEANAHAAIGSTVRFSIDASQVDIWTNPATPGLVSPAPAGAATTHATRAVATSSVR